MKRTSVNSETTTSSLNIQIIGLCEGEEGKIAQISPNLLTAIKPHPRSSMKLRVKKKNEENDIKAHHNQIAIKQ
jgi:hypothetical protein